MMGDILTFVGIIGGGLLAVILGVLAYLVTPVGFAVLGAVAGEIAVKIGVATIIVDGFGYLGLEIPVEGLPMVGAALGFVGAFFRSHQSNTNKCKN